MFLTRGSGGPPIGLKEELHNLKHGWVSGEVGDGCGGGLVNQRAHQALPSGVCQAPIYCNSLLKHPYMRVPGEGQRIYERK